MNEPRVSIASKIREAQTPAERLRQILTRLESLVGQIGSGTQEKAANILSLLDQAHTLAENLKQQGADLGPERLRLQSIIQQLDRKSKPFLRQLGGAEVLAELRDARKPPTDHVWWYADLQLQRQQHDRKRKILMTIGTAAVVLMILTALYMRFLAPDEATRGRYSHEQNAEQALSRGDVEGALAEATLALSFAPGDGDLLVLQGVAYELLGSEELAQARFDAARTAYEDSETLYLRRAQNYITAGRADLALADANRVIDSNPTSAIAYFQRGIANAELGELSHAIDDMEKASELAEAAQQPELQGMARVQLGNLMMLMSAPQFEEPTPTP
jgi:tetratricopeptide (TPR) repeat protein